MKYEIVDKRLKRVEFYTVKNTDSKNISASITKLDLLLDQFIVKNGHGIKFLKILFFRGKDEHFTNSEQLNVC